jgi:hypothetical protein
MATKRPRVSEGQAWQDAELFPTPPWAVRALLSHVLCDAAYNPLHVSSVWEPCAGLGHISETLGEYFGLALASDLHVYDGPFGSMADHGVSACNFLDQFDTGNFLAHNFAGQRPNWIITNPPFGLAASMLQRALSVANDGVAFLLRIQWQESEARYNEIFNTLSRPSLTASFAGRVAMCEGGWDPKLATATAYRWFIWRLRDGRVQHAPANVCGLQTIPDFIIPFDARKRLTRPHDQRLATRHVHGWVPPSTLKKAGKDQLSF